MGLTRRVSLLAVASLILACNDDSLPSAVAPTVTEPSVVGWSSMAQLTQSIAPIRALTVPTYDGTGQLVHPDIVYVPAGWNGWEYWMAFTPYAKADSSRENPSIVVSHDGITWSVPPGAVNPLVAPVRKGYNSDPDLTLDPATHQLVMIYREVSGGYNQIKSLRSSDGVHWTAPVLVFKRHNHGMVSPAVTAVPGGAPKLWYVDAGPRKCLERVTKIFTQDAQSFSSLTPTTAEQGWTAPVKVQLSQPTYYIWHLDVTWVPERHEYWAIYPAYRQRVCGGRSLFFARSPDGIKWTTYKVPFMRPRDVPWMNMTVYRTTSLYDASRNAIRLWISAAAPGNNWSLSYVEYNFTSFLQSLQNAAPESPLTTSSASALFGVAMVVGDDGP